MRSILPFDMLSQDTHTVAATSSVEIKASIKPDKTEKKLPGWILDDPTVDEPSVDEPTVEDLIDRSAKRMSRCCGHSPSDQEDLKQDMRIFLIEKEDQYDPDRSPVVAYVNCLLRTWVLMRIRYSKRLIRKGHLSTRWFGDHDEPMNPSKSEIDCKNIDTADLLEACRSRLSSDEFQLLISVSQIGKSRTASELCISRSQVYIRLSQIRSTCSDLEEIFNFPDRP